MSKYNQLKYLKKIKARVYHQCNYCGETIPPGEYYYREVIRDKFLHFLHARSFCINCYEEHGEALLKMKRKEAITSETSLRKLNTYFREKNKTENKP